MTMRLTNYEKETIINFNEGEDTASVYTHNGALRRRLEQLAQERPEECRLVKTCHDGQAVEYYIPKKWLRVNPTRQVSDAQREALEKARRASKLPALTGVGDTTTAVEGNYTTRPTPPSEHGVRTGEEGER